MILVVFYNVSFNMCMRITLVFFLLICYILIKIKMKSKKGGYYKVKNLEGFLKNRVDWKSFCIKCLC